MLHSKRELNTQSDIFSSNLDEALPSHRIPQKQNDPDQVLQIISDELMLDGNARQNLATFCGTWEEPQVHTLMDLAISKNIVDKDEYPQTAEIEARCINILAHLWNCPEEKQAIGTSTTGSSEAAMLGGLALKRLWEAKRKSAGKSIERPNLVSGPVQVCWHKFARYFDVELREIPMQDSTYTSTGEQVFKYCDENTIGVVSTLGTTFTGQYEPVAKISKALDDFQEKTGLDIPLHVDAASGGFVAPFLDSNFIWDFQLPRVHSINSSGHKYGLAPLGLGWILWRQKDHLPEELIFHVNYLGGDMPSFSLNFSRPGGQVIVQYYNFLRLGYQGYRKINQELRNTATYLAQKLVEIGPFEIIHNPIQGLPVVTWKLSEDAKTSFNLFDLSNQLRTWGWQVPTYTLPANLENLAIQRVVVRHGFYKDLANQFLQDVQRSLNYFDSHPMSHSLDQSEGTGFHHN